MAERYRNVVTTSNPDQIRFDTADPRYKLARKVDIGTGSYGSTSPFRDPRRLAGDTNNRFRGTDPGFGRGSWNWTGDGVEEASRRSTNKAVTVEARTVEGSTRQTLGNRARVSVANATDRFGKGVSSAKSAFGKGTAGAAGNTAQSAASANAQSAARSSASSAVGKGVGAVAGVGKVVSGSASGGPSVGWYKGGFGVGVSAGGLDLGVGFASVSYNFSNPNESAIGGAFNTLTIKGTQEGCTITLDYQFMGNSYFKETRQADNCRKPEPDPPGRRIDNQDDEIGKDPSPLPEPTPPPGTGMTTTTSSSTGNWIKAEVPCDLWYELETFGGQGRNVYYHDGFTLTKITDMDYNDFYFESSPTNQVHGFLRGRFAFKEVTSKTKIPFWTDPYYMDFFDINITGTYYGTSTTYYLVLDRDNLGNIEEFYLGAASDSRVEYGNFDYPDDAMFIRVFGGTGTGSTGIDFWQSDVLQSRDPNNPNNNPINNTVETFLYTRKYSDLNWIVIPTEDTPTLPQSQTVSTPRALEEPMEDRQQILLERVYQMLGGDTFWENGLAVPNQLFTPEGEGYTRTKSYNGVAHLLFDTLDHRTPGQVEYKLPNGMEYKSINAQGYFQDLGANVAETLEETKKKESNNSQVMNYLTRNSFINTQILKILIQTNRIVRAILSFLNVPVSPEVENVDIPFDMSLGGKLGKKGFGSPKEMDQELEKLFQEQLKTDPKGEKIAATFGNNGQTKIPTVKIIESSEGGDFWWFIKEQLRGK